MKKLDFFFVSVVKRQLLIILFVSVVKRQLLSNFCYPKAKVCDLFQLLEGNCQVFHVNNCFPIY